MGKERKTLLYHYTTMRTFYEMMEHSLYYKKGEAQPKFLTMWATHYAYQNDPTECQLFFDGLKKAITDYTLKKGVVLGDEYNECMEQSFQYLNLFTISFSEQEDDLSMWRGYGQNGDGISLGFDFSGLPSIRPMYALNDKEHQCGSQMDDLLRSEIKKCKYVDTDSIQVSEEVSRNLLNTNVKEHDMWTDVKWLITIIENAPIYKHYKYSVEKEWRIIKNHFMSEFRTVDGCKIIPYMKVNIPIDCLKRIIIGPCQASAEAVMNISSFLMTKGINIEVISSHIPYRNRI